MPEALVWIGSLGLLIYRTDPPLVTSRGQTPTTSAFRVLISTPP